MASENSITNICEPANTLTNIDLNTYTSLRFSRLVKKVNGLYIVQQPLKEEELVYCAKYLLSRNFKRGEKLNTPIKTKDYFITKLAPYKREVFVVLFLNGGNRIIGYEKIAVGTFNRAVVYPRELIKRALTKNASAVIVAHNHLSTTTEPSSDDIKLTLSLAFALQTVEIRLLDHVIVGGGRAFSFVEQELMTEILQNIHR
jgi:DNA repair protein RadC